MAATKKVVKKAAKNKNVVEVLKGILGNKDDMNALDAMYKKIKKDYDAVIKFYRTWEKISTNREVYKDAAAHASIAQYMLSVHNACYVTALGAYRERRSIARRLAVQLIAAGKKHNKEADEVVKTESAKLFDFDLI